MGKEVTGAGGCKDDSLTAPKIEAKKYEAVKREKAEENDNKSQGGGKKDDGATGNTGSTNSAGSSGNGGSSNSSGSSNNVNEAAENKDKETETCKVTYMSARKQHAEQEVEKGQSVKKLPDNPEDERAEFKGWFMEANEKGDKKKFTGSVKVKEDITVYAKWVYEIKYTNGDKVLYRREIKIEAPGDEVDITMNLEPKTGGGDVHDWEEK